MRHFKMVVTVVALLVVFFWSVPSSEAQIEPEWTTTFDFGGDYDNVSSMIIDQDENLVINGWQETSTSNPVPVNAVLASFSPDGVNNWTFVNNLDEWSMGGLSMLTRIGNALFWVYAVIPENGGTEWWLTRRNSIGEEVWAVPLSTTNTKITSYGNSILAVQEGTSSDNPARAIVFDTSGTRVDSMIIVDKMWAVKATPTVQGDFLWISFNYPEPGINNSAAAIVKYDLINREVVWRWNLSDGIRPFSTVDSVGNTYFICSRGVENDEGSVQFVAAKLDPDGNEVWRTEWFGRDTYETNHENWVNSIDMFEYRGTVIVAGSIQRGDTHSSNKSCYLANLNAETGNIIWEEAWEWDLNAVVNGLNACRFDQNGNLYVTGKTFTGLGAPNVCFLRKYSHHLMDAPESGIPGPETFVLSQNYPNPFNAATRISFAISVTSEVELSVYSMLGREVAHLASGRYGAGTHTVSFAPDLLPSGMYFYRLRAGEVTKTKTMVLVK